MCPLQAVFFTSTCAINWPKYGIFSRVVCISEIDVWVQDASNEYTKASSKIVSRNNRFSGGSFSKYLVGTNCVYSTVLGPGCSCVWDMVPPRADSVHLQRLQHPRPSSRPTGSETGAAVWVRQAASDSGACSGREPPALEPAAVCPPPTCSLSISGTCVCQSWFAQV